MNKREHGSRNGEGFRVPAERITELWRKAMADVAGGFMDKSFIPGERVRTEDTVPQQFAKLLMDEISARSERRPNFPMMDGPPIPWELAEAIWQGYAALFGKGQKLERVGERGGFGWGEVAAFWSKPKAREAITAALVANHEPAKPDA